VCVGMGRSSINIIHQTISGMRVRMYKNVS